VIPDPGAPAVGARTGYRVTLNLGDRDAEGSVLRDPG
jgi:hypothetical protein